MNYTESQIKKLEDWAKGLGYPDSRGNVFLVTDHSGYRSAWCNSAVGDVVRHGRKILGILDKDFVFHKVPEFAEDEEIKEALKIFADDSEMRRIFEFLFDKVDAIERKVEGEGK